MANLSVPERTLNRIVKVLDAFDKGYPAPAMINEQQACELLGIKKVTLNNYVSKGLIPKSYYTTGVGGNRFFDKNKLMGLK